MQDKVKDQTLILCYISLLWRKSIFLMHYIYKISSPSIVWTHCSSKFALNMLSFMFTSRLTYTSQFQSFSLVFEWKILFETETCYIEINNKWTYVIWKIYWNLILLKVFGIILKYARSIFNNWVAPFVFPSIEIPKHDLFIYMGSLSMKLMDILYHLKCKKETHFENLYQV